MPTATPAPTRVAKVPAVTSDFWLLKVIATTAGETGGDALSMSLGLGYLASTGVFALVFVAAVATQMRARTFRPLVYWLTIVATTTVGTTLADFADRSLGIGYLGGSALLLVLLLLSLALWHRRLGSIAVGSVRTPQAEVFYWTTIMISQTLGTALGDWVADTQGLGYAGGILVFGSLLAALAIGYCLTALPTVLLFWAAFALTRPLGAVIGDLLDKPFDSGGLDLERLPVTLALLGLMLVGILLLPQRAAEPEAQH